MRKFVLNRDYVLRTTKGHSIAFKKGQPTYVPRIIEREAVSIGAECVEGTVKMLDDDKPLEIELSPDERNEKIIEAFRSLVKRNGREDFTGTGQPAVKAVETLTGFDVSREEVASMWAEFRVKEGI